MKRNNLLLILAATLLLSSCSYTVYPVKSKPKWAASGGMIYALPQTELLIDMTLSSHDTTGAPFAQYATEMLGADDANTHYTISQVSLSAHNIADPNAYYYVVPRRMAVVIDHNHLIRSIGIDPTKPLANATNPITIESKVGQHTAPILGYNLYDRTDTFYVKGDKPGNPSMLSAKPDVKSTRQRAMEAAEELEEVQDRLQSFNNGDFDDEYTMDQIQYITQKLRQREEELLRQFVGKAINNTVRLTMTPKDERTKIEDQTQIICYYSPLLGIVDSTIFNAEPVYCRVQCDNATRKAARFVKYRQDGQQGTHISKNRQSFKYRLAESARVTVYCSHFRISKIMPIVQFGPTIDLPRRRFQAVFDTLTGDLLYYSGL